ncbi:hypothetical protein ASE73_02300 [Sphingomonas sp. Leaf24]|uniref:hypothetical protein n=1 Tax=unclassified Sphingomonas TaxID=196159 RepID=UPI000701F58B|nr:MULTISPECIES: hypothetical protein [unclassified Sphingomonas]KQM23074.1 hypothetical protein ASE50_02300 [Sphingomonas sp. Leaf5]KQM95932.1 hypothetical protein ASE73_02300 [Sphingomonas sp. Leaf24]
MRALLVMLGGSLMLAACGPSAEQQAAANQAAIANSQEAQEMTAKVDALAPGQREGVFIRAIRDAGLPCQGVTASERGEKPGSWVATCQEGSRHIITFGANGMANVTSFTPQPAAAR